MAPYINGDDTYVSEDFLVNLSDDHGVSKVHCRWRVADRPAKAETARYFHSIDLLLRVQPHTTDEGEGPPVESSTGTALETLVRRACPDQSGVTTKVILAPVDGYLCRADILDLRMRHSECVDTVVSFASWNRRLPGFSRHDRRTLLPLLLSSPGAIVVKRTAEPRFDLRKDIEMRLSFDWILPQKPAAYKVALVAGRHRYKSGRYRAQGFLDAARALGIAITILDREGHWLQEQTYAHSRDDFIAVDLSHDAWLPQRISNAVRGREFDGLVTFTDEYVLAAGEAAEMLGLPTEPFRAIQLALHKEQMRKVVDYANIQAFLLQRAGQLHDPVSASSLENLRYPLVVKPAYGRSSEGVRKVTDEIGMREAVGMLTADGLADQGILLETYVDGPELDCNFVLCDGEVLFLELTDDLPSTADASDATLADNFSETVMISHSGLPAAEQEALRDSLQCSLRDLGFRWGIFHAEARMQHSSVRYDADQNLVPTTPAPSCEPTPFLIEVNVRPPGIGSSFTPLYTYGIDCNQNAWTVEMLEKTSSATWLAREKMLVSRSSLFTSNPMQTPVTMTIAGTTHMVMRVSFHCTAKATMNAATNVAQLCTKTDSFSEIPFVTRLPFMVTFAAGEPVSLDSKKLTSWRSRLCRKCTRNAFVARMAPVEAAREWMYTRENLAMKR